MVIWRTRIATSAAAMAFVRSLEPFRRTSYHRKVAERMIHFAWMIAEDEALAERAVMIAVETDACNSLTPESCLRGWRCTASKTATSGA